MEWIPQGNYEWNWSTAVGGYSCLVDAVDDGNHSPPPQPTPPLQSCHQMSRSAVIGILSNCSVDWIKCPNQFHDRGNKRLLVGFKVYLVRLLKTLHIQWIAVKVELSAGDIIILY